MPSINGTWSSPSGDYWDLLGTSYGISGEEWNLYGGNKATGWPLNFMRTGYYESSHNHSYKNWGIWWGNTAISSKESNQLFISSDVGSAGGTQYYSVSRGYGLAIRCVVRS